jgi:PUA-domain protein
VYYAILLISFINVCKNMASSPKPELYKKRMMRRRDARRLLEEAEALLGRVKSNTLSQAEMDDGTIVYIIDGEVQLARSGDRLFPTLMNLTIEGLPAVIVDMGAVPYVCKGADVMAPGIVEVQGMFSEGDYVVIRDVNHKKALAIGTALVPSEKVGTKEKGKTILNIHYVGDKLWNAVT